MPLPQAEYEAQLHALIQSQDFEGAAALQRQQGLGNSEGAAAGSGQDSECGDDVERFCEDEDVSAESCAHEEPVDEAAASVQVLKMLYKGNMEEVSRQEQQDRKAKFFSRKHSFYRNTRVTSVAQEEQSALPAGVLNVHEDSDDTEAYSGEQLEIAKEIDELRVATQWINQEGWDAAAEGRAFSKGNGRELDLRMNWDEVKATLAKGGGGEVNGMLTQFVQDESSGHRPGLLIEAKVKEDYPIHRLDPTQKVFFSRVMLWAADVVKVYKNVHKTGKWEPIPVLRSFLCGSAGSGKSTTLKTTVQHIRLLFQKEQVDAKVELTAFTGVAAFNIGFGAKTACSAFQVFPNVAWKSELEGEAFKRLERTWSSVVLLIVDEVSFIGRAFFAKMHFRVQQGKRRFYSERGIDPTKGLGFADTSIILVGDFGQLDPIDDWSMCDNEATYMTCPKNQKHLWKHALQGHRLLQTFDEAIILKQIHRSKEDKWWTESCLRLRNFECTKEDDWDYWREHDLDRGHFNQEQIDYFENEAVWLCARCEDVGTRNGRKLAQMADRYKELIHKIVAVHSRKSACKLSSVAFEGLRPVIHLVRGCKVMLCRNIAYLFGLANGTRGTLVGVVYGSAGVGSFPEALIVDFPSYNGPRFYSGEPTWVPVLPMVAFKEGTRLTRKQFPVVAGFALTVNKAQGLTLTEGVVIHLTASKRFRPASKHGLPFVAFTRSENFAMTAFKNLPPWDDFLKGKDSDMLRMRLEFETRLNKLHQRTVAHFSSMKTEEQEVIAHENWRQKQTKRRRAEGPKKPCPSCNQCYSMML